MDIILSYEKKKGVGTLFVLILQGGDGILPQFLATPELSLFFSLLVTF